VQNIYVNQKIKNQTAFAIWFSGSAQNKTRTCTPLPAPAPQAGVSTNFTIWAKIRFNGLMVLRFKGPKVQGSNVDKALPLYTFMP
jgi:hypothetical protein